MPVLRLVVLVFGLSLWAACTPPLSSVTPVAGRSGSSGDDNALPREPDVLYVPTPPAMVAKMLEIARVTKDDVVYDLGSGDGRIVIMAAQRFGARGVGVEIDPDWCGRHARTLNGPVWPVGYTFCSKTSLIQTSGTRRW